MSQCARCGMWIYQGAYHVCPVPYQYPSGYTTYQEMLSPTLERIAIALEKLVEQNKK